MTQSDQRYCRWCGAPATHEREVEPEKINAKTKEVIRPPIMASVCEEHNAMFDREERRRELGKQIARWQAARAKKRPYNVAGLAKAKEQLRQLDTWEPQRRTG